MNRIQSVPVIQLRPGTYHYAQPTRRAIRGPMPWSMKGKRTR